MRLFLILFALSFSFWTPSSQAVDIVQLKSLKATDVCARLLSQEHFNPVKDDAASVTQFERESSDLNRSLEQKMADARARLEALYTQLSLPEEQRAEKDTRWTTKLLSVFVTLDPNTNPVTIKLREAIAETERMIARLESLRAQIQTVIKMKGQRASKENDPDFMYFDFILEWIQVRTNQVLTKIIGLSENNLDQDEFKNIEASMQSIETDINAYSQSLQSRIANNDIINRFVQDRSRVLMLAGKEWASREMGRDLKDYTIHRLIGLSLQFNKKFGEILVAFRAIDDYGSKSRKDGIYDNIVIELLSTMLQNGQTPQSVTDRFFEISNLGKATKKKFTIPDLECTTLTDLSFETNQTAQRIVEIFFRLERLGTEKGDKPETKLESLNDPALVILTRLAIVKKLSDKDIDDLVTKVFDFDYKARTQRDNFYINNLGLALLVEQESMTSRVDLMDFFFKVYEELQKVESLKHITDENIAHIAAFATAYQLEASTITRLLSSLQEHQFTLHRGLSIIGLALSEKEVLGEVRAQEWRRFDEMASDLARIPWLEISRLEDQLVDTEHAEREAARQRSRRASAGSSYSSRSSSDRSESRSSDDVGFSMTTHGPQVGLGGGLAVDLDGGGLRYNIGGGVSIGLTGDHAGSIGIKLF